MSIFETKVFSRFARRAGLSPDQLLEAARQVEAGVFDADLGGGVFKQRVARDGGGKSGGFRTIIVFKAGGHSFFVHGFAKNQKASVSAKELKALKALAQVLTGLDARALERAVAVGEMARIGAGSDGEDKKG